MSDGVWWGIAHSLCSDSSKCSTKLRFSSQSENITSPVTFIILWPRKTHACPPLVKWIVNALAFSQDLNHEPHLLEEKSNPRGIEWLWSPISIRMFLSVMARSKRHLTQEAAIEALQNMTAGNGEVRNGIAQFFGPFHKFRMWDMKMQLSGTLLGLFVIFIYAWTDNGYIFDCAGYCGSVAAVEELFNYQLLCSEMNVKSAVC